MLQSWCADACSVHARHKSPPELVVEERVDDWVHSRVDVSQPRGEKEEGHGGHEVLQTSLERDGSQDVAGEEGDPAEQEDAFERYT